MGCFWRRILGNQKPDPSFNGLSWRRILAHEMPDRSDEATRREVERWRNAPRRRPTQIETPAAGQESVWDYPRPPRIESVDARVQVWFADVALADTASALRVCETSSPPTIYLPRESVRMDLLEPAPEVALCEWKGTARYYSVRAGEQVAFCVAWSYPEPFEGYEALTDRMAFFPGRVDACFLGDERVTPQPGEYYGGWVTQNLVGPFKGEPGTEDW